MKTLPIAAGAALFLGACSQTTPSPPQGAAPAGPKGREQPSLASRNYPVPPGAGPDALAALYPAWKAASKPLVQSLNAA